MLELLHLLDTLPVFDSVEQALADQESRGNRVVRVTFGSQAVEARSTYHALARGAPGAQSGGGV